MKLERKPGSVFVNVAPELVPASVNPTEAVHLSDADSRSMVRSAEYESTWNGIADHMKSLVPTAKPASASPATSKAPESVTTPEPSTKTRTDAPKLSAEGHQNDRFLRKILASLRLLGDWASADEVFKRYKNKYNLVNVADIQAGLAILVDDGRVKAKLDEKVTVYLAEQKSDAKPLADPTEVRVLRHSHFDGSQTLIYKGPRTDDVEKRCVDYAKKSGFKVSLICQHPYEHKTFDPPVLREDPDAPPTSDPDVVSEEKIEGLGWNWCRDNESMYLTDDRKDGHWTERKGKRAPIVAWLNYHKREGCYHLNIRMKNAFGIEAPIPSSIDNIDGALEWVYRKSYWVCDHVEEVS